MSDDFKDIFIVMAWSLFVVVVIIISTRIIQISFVDNVPTICFVDEEKVYEGPSVGIKIDSSGANTTVNISGGFLYLFPQKFYVSKNIKLIGQKRNI